MNSGDYFSLVNSSPESSIRAESPEWPRLASANPPRNLPSLYSEPSSNHFRGSWSNLFNAGSVRQFVIGVQDFKDGLITPTEIPPHRATGLVYMQPQQLPDYSRSSVTAKTSSLPSTSSISKSLSDAGSITQNSSISFSSASHGYVRKPNRPNVRDFNHPADRNDVSLDTNQGIIFEKPRVSDEYAT
jgi:hypothetical protein